MSRSLYRCSVIDLKWPMTSLAGNVAEDTKGAAAKGILLPVLTASSLWKRDLREHHHGCHRHCPAAWTWYCLIWDTQSPERTLPFVAVILSSYDNGREEISFELTRYRGREALDICPVVTSLWTKTPLLTTKLPGAIRKKAVQRSRGTTPTVCSFATRNLPQV